MADQSIEEVFIGELNQTLSILVAYDTHPKPVMGNEVRAELRKTIIEIGKTINDLGRQAIQERVEVSHEPRLRGTFAPQFADLRGRD